MKLPATDLPSSQSVDKGACGLADPRAFHVTSAPAPFLGKSPRVTGCLPAHLPLDTVGPGQEGWHWQGLLLPPSPAPPSHPSAQAQGPQKGTFGAVPRWPCLAPSPLPLGWAGALLLRTVGGQPGPDGTVRGAGAAALPTPVRPSRSSPMSSQCRRPQGATSPAACPLVPVAAVCGVAPSPGAGSAGPPLPSTLPGAFLCRFLNVILKSEKGYYAFL